MTKLEILELAKAKKLFSDVFSNYYKYSKDQLKEIIYALVESGDDIDSDKVIECLERYLDE